MVLLGDVAQLCRQTQSLLAPPPALTIQQVYSTLRKIRYAYPNYGTGMYEDAIMYLLVHCLKQLHDNKVLNYFP